MMARTAGSGNGDAGRLAKSGAVLVPVAVLLAALVALLVWVPRQADGAVATDTMVVSDATSDQVSPDLDGGYAVWEDKRNGNSDIYAKNLSAPGAAEFQVTADPAEQRKPKVSGSFVVWEDERDPAGNGDIYGKDLSDPNAQEIAIATGPAEQRKPDIDGNRVVWREDDGSGRKIRGYDISSAQSFTVADNAGNKDNPRISGEFVVFQDDRRGVGTSDIYAVRLLPTGPEEILVTNDATTADAFKDQPSVSNGVVVWRQESVANYDIFGRDLYAKDLETGQVFQITTSPADQSTPVIEGNLVVYTDNRDGDANVYGYDLSTKQEFPVIVAPGPQETPAISGETVVWEEQQTGSTNYGTYDIAGSTLDAAPSIPAGATARGTSSGVTLSWTANAEGDVVGYNVYRGDSQGGSYVLLNGGGPISGTSYADPNAPKGVRSYYKITALDARNESGAALADTVAPGPSRITLASSVSQLAYNGGTTNLSGRLTSASGEALANKVVALQRRVAGVASWSAVPNGRVATNGAGSFSLPGVRVDNDTDYRAVFAGSEEALPSVSAPVRVDVKLLVSVGASVKLGKVNRVLRISGVVLPAQTGSVKLTIKRNGAVVQRSFSLVNDSRYSLLYKPRFPGLYTVTALFVGGNEPAGATNTASFRVKP